MRTFILAWIDYIRETREDGDFVDKFAGFFISCILLFMIIGTCFVYIQLVYLHPKPVLAISVTIWGLWQVYKRI